MKVKTMYNMESVAFCLKADGVLVLRAILKIMKFKNF